MLSETTIDHLLTSACSAALLAGSSINELYTHTDNFKVSMKADNTPLVPADCLSHTIIRDHLSRSTHLPVLSEEGRDMLYEERRGWDLYWLVDPLDGTEEFIKRNGEFTVNIALISSGKPILGVIYLPTAGTLYFNIPSRGAFCNTSLRPLTDTDSSLTMDEIMAGARRLPLHKRAAGSPLRVLLSRSHETFPARAYLSEQGHDTAVEFLEYGSSLKFCLLAEGSADVYIRTTVTWEWDTAAGEAIVVASGCGMHDTADDRPLVYNKESLENPAFVCHRVES